jgi:hypothetical protein
MDWYYAENGQQQGPISEAELMERVRAGRIVNTTLVWNPSLTNWQPYEQVKPLAAPGSPPLEAPPVVGTAGVVCAECGKTVSPEEAVRLRDTWVCAACKPIFVQRLAEGAALPSPGLGSLMPGVGGLTEQQLLERPYRIELGPAIERAWRMFKENFGLVLPATLVWGLVVFAAAVISGLVGMVIPLGNNILSVLYPGPVFGGYLWFLLRVARAEPATLADAFAGFGPRFGQLLLSSLIQGLLNFAAMIPVVIVAMGMGFSIVASGRGQIPQPAAMTGLVAILLGVGLITIAALIYLNTLWTFSLLLVIDKHYRFWDAMQLSRKMVSRQWWMTFLFLFVGGLIMLLGFCACGVGALVSAPIYFGMRVILYEENFRELIPQR